MTDKVNPSVNRPAEAFTTAGAIAYGGGSKDGYIVESQNTTEMSIQSPDINESSLNEFSQTNSGLDVSISGGEAFVFGAWLAIDEATTVTLPPSTTSTIYVGWNRDGADDVIIGLESAFNDASGAADQKIPLFTFDTNATVVTSVTDERSFEQISADISGGYSTVVTKTSDHTATDRQVILADATSNDIDITLPSPTDGQLVTVKKIDSSNNAVNIVTPGNETIDGHSSIVITSQFAARETASNGTNYFII